MTTGLLALKWNHHNASFLKVLSDLRHKDKYCDATIACDGMYYPVHKIVLSTCSEYFEEIFERTDCKHPVIVLKDVHSEDLEALLNYMYIGEVNVLQMKLASLIKNAENLRIKGLAVPDVEPKAVKSPNKEKRSIGHGRSPRPKRRKTVSEDNSESEKCRTRSQTNHCDDEQKITNDELSSINNLDCLIPEINVDEDQIGNSSNSQASDAAVKDEPSDGEDLNKGDLHAQLGLNFDSCDLTNEATYSSQHVIGTDNPSSFDNVLGHSLAGPSGLQQASNIWDGNGSMEGASTEGLSNDLNANRQSASGTGETWNYFDTNIVCQICNKSFSRKDSLQRHMKIHMELRPFQCPYCPYNCIRKDHLQLHVRGHYSAMRKMLTKDVKQTDPNIECSNDMETLASQML